MIYYTGMHAIAIYFLHAGALKNIKLYYVLHIGKWDRTNGISQSIDIDTMYGSYYQSSVINPETHNIYTDY